VEFSISQQARDGSEAGARRVPHAPGMGITGTFCRWASVMSGTPGSLMDGVPVGRHGEGVKAQ
jgi:hypothetical protein